MEDQGTARVEVSRKSMTRTTSRKDLETTDEESPQAKMKLKTLRSNARVTSHEEEVESHKLRVLKMSRNYALETAHQESCLVNLKTKKA